jgi:hypothetical protein
MKGNRTQPKGKAYDYKANRKMEFEYFKEEILRLSQFNEELKQLNRVMREFYVDKPITVVLATPPFLARARVNYNGVIFSKRGEMSFNPFKDQIEMQRANYPGQQVFYGSCPTKSDLGSCQNTALMETVWEHVKDHKIMRQYLTLGRWKVKRPLRVCILPFSDISCQQNGDFREANENYHNFLDKQLQNISVSKRKEYLGSLEFISTIFCQTEKKEFCYRISASYFNMIKYNIEANGMFLDGLIYPSANTGAAGMNIALSGEIINENTLEFDNVVMMAMQRNPSDPKRITFEGVSNEAIPDSTGRFKFSNIW